MPISTIRSSRYRKSLSSLLSWSRYNSIPPILFPGDNDKLEYERRRELQLTLDKLEGRVTINTKGDLQWAESKDEASDDVCGLMSILGDRLIDINVSESGVVSNGLGNPSDYKEYSDWVAGRSEEPSPEFTTTMVSGGITHPAFSWSPDQEERWETSSRISEDSLFDDHTRQPPGSPLDCTNKAVILFRYAHHPCFIYPT